MFHDSAIRRLLQLYLVGLLVVLGGCQPVQQQVSGGASATTSSSAAALPDLGTIQIGYLPFINNTPLFVAVEKGYFAEQGIQVELQRMASSEDQVPLIITGKLDVAIVNALPGLFNSIQQGLGIRIIANADNAVEPVGHPRLVVRKELFDSGEVTKLADLKGHSVVMNSTGGLPEYLLSKALGQVSLTVDDVKIVVLPRTELPAAFANGAVDAGSGSALTMQQLISKGLAVKLIASNEIVESVQGNLVVVGGRMLQPENREVVIRLLMAYLKASRELAGDKWMTEEYITIINKYTEMTPETINALNAPIYDEERQINAESLLDQQAYAIRRGYLAYQEPLPIEAMVDASFLNEAVKQMSK